MREEEIKNLGEKISLLVQITIFLLIVGFLLKVTSSFMIPFVIAILLYFLFSPLIDQMEKVKIPHWAAMILVAFIVLGVVTLLGVLTYSSVEILANGLPKYQSKLQGAIKYFVALGEKYPSLKIEEIVKNINLGAAGSFALKTMGSFMQFLTALTLMLLFFFFMLIGKGNLEKKIKKIYSYRRSSKFMKIYREMTAKIYRYLWAKTIVSMITGFNVGLILAIFGIDFAFVWGFLTFLFNYIPTIGSIIITIPPLIIAILKFGKVTPVTFLLILLIANHMTMGNIVEPRWMGKTLNLSPLLILFSLIFWGWLWGVVGMLISVPVLSVIKIVLESIPQTQNLAKLMES